MPYSPTRALELLRLGTQSPAAIFRDGQQQQARNVDGSVRIQGNVPTGPVLLVDDMVDSRWTLTVAAYLLTTQGTGPLSPLALASTANADE